MIVNLTNNIQVNTANNTYNNCHKFTRDVLIVAYNNNHAIISRQVALYMVELINQTLPHNIPVAINETYADMINSGNATLFNRANHANVPAGSLIIFTTYTGVQHSMIKIENDTWIGANNIGSLGIAGAVANPPANIQTNPTDVCTYANMSLRMHVHAINGGWDINNIMTSWYEHVQYSMYHVPIF